MRPRPVAKFGDHIPLVRRHDIQGYIPAKPVWQMRPLGIDTVRAHAREMERTAARFYRQALTRTTDASTRKLLGDLAEEEEKHDQIAAGLEEQILTTSARGAEAENERRRFVLQVIQPGLVGLMDGSVSTLAPVFAAAFATQNSWNAFLVGNPPKKIMTRYMPRFSRSAKVDYHALYHMNVATDEQRKQFIAKVRAAMVRF